MPWRIVDARTRDYVAGHDDGLPTFTDHRFRAVAFPSADRAREFIRQTLTRGDRHLVLMRDVGDDRRERAPHHNERRA